MVISNQAWGWTVMITPGGNPLAKTLPVIPLWTRAFRLPLNTRNIGSFSPVRGDFPILQLHGLTIHWKQQTLYDVLGDPKWLTLACTMAHLFRHHLLPGMVEGSSFWCARWLLQPNLRWYFDSADYFGPSWYDVSEQCHVAQGIGKFAFSEPQNCWRESWVKICNCWSE